MKNSDLRLRLGQGWAGVRRGQGGCGLHRCGARRPGWGDAAGHACARARKPASSHTHQTKAGGSPLETAWKKKQAVTRMAARNGQQPIQNGDQSIWMGCSPAARGAAKLGSLHTQRGGGTGHDGVGVINACAHGQGVPRDRREPPRSRAGAAGHPACPQAHPSVANWAVGRAAALGAGDTLASSWYWNAGRRSPLRSWGKGGHGEGGGGVRRGDSLRCGVFASHATWRRAATTPARCCPRPAPHLHLPAKQHAGCHQRGNREEQVNVSYACRQQVDGTGDVRGRGAAARGSGDACSARMGGGRWGANRCRRARTAACRTRRPACNADANGPRPTHRTAARS